MTSPELPTAAPTAQAPSRALADPADSSQPVAGPVAPLWAKLLLLPAVVAMTLTLDQGTKLLAQAELATATTQQVNGGEPGETRKVWVATRTVTVIKGLFDLRYVENPAAAFSLTGSLPEWFRKPFLVVVSMLAMMLILTWYWKTREPDWLILASFAFILGGALGNLVDRVAYGYVIDFIDWHLAMINPAWPHWPTFNIADSAICVGAGGVILRTFKPYVPPVVATPAPRWPAPEANLVDGVGNVATTDASGEHESLTKPVS